MDTSQYIFGVYMNTLNERLKEERVRLGFTQQDFAEKGGVKRRAQAHYEAGERCSDGHYYGAIAAAGADVQYILTGIKSASAPVPITKPLTERQKALLDNYDNTSTEGQKIIEATANAASESKRKKAG